MICLQLSVLFNVQMCGTFLPVFVNISLGRGAVLGNSKLLY